jgi:hypothetical protein
LMRPEVADEIMSKESRFVIPSRNLTTQTSWSIPNNSSSTKASSTS